jgi:hypothetical protein
MNVETLKHKLRITEETMEELLEKLAALGILVVILTILLERRKSESSNLIHGNSKVITNETTTSISSGIYSRCVGSVIANNDTIVLTKGELGIDASLSGTSVCASSGSANGITINKNGPLTRVIINRNEVYKINTVLTNEERGIGSQMVDIILSSIVSERNCIRVGNNSCLCINGIHVGIRTSNHEMGISNQAVLVIGVNGIKIAVVATA